MDNLSNFEIGMVSGGGVVSFFANTIGLGMMVAGPIVVWISGSILYSESNPNVVLPGENRFTAVARQMTYKPENHMSTIGNCWLGVAAGLAITYVGYKLWNVEGK